MGGFGTEQQGHLHMDLLPNPAFEAAKKSLSQKYRQTHQRHHLSRLAMFPPGC